MIDPYRMVFIGIISSIIALLILLIYFKLYKKQKINYVFLLLIISIPPIVSIFRPGSYESGDLSLHTMRTISFYNILFNEHLLPRWTPEFNVGYGDPYFLFAYFLPYFIGSLLHFIGFSFLDSIKILLALSFIFSGLAMYVWAKDELGEKAGFVSALFYLFAPYHLVDLHFRVTIAETLSFVFLPILLLLTKKIIYRPTIPAFISFVICYALLVLTHQITSLTFSPILFSYALLVWFLKKKRAYKSLLIYFSSIFLGLLLSAFYWLPIVTEAQYIQASMSKNILSFTPLKDLLYSPWRLGFLFQGHKGELSFVIGYTQLLMVLLAVFLLIKKRLEDEAKKFLLFFLILFFILAFMITPQSKEIWKMLPLLKYSQYSYRLLEMVALCTSIIAGIVVTKWKRTSFIVIICLITAFYTLLNWGNRKALAHIQDAYLMNEFKNKPDIPIYLEPSSPIWADLRKSKLRIKPKAHIEILSGKAEIKELSRKSISHTYLIYAKTDVEIKENTLYFPGWKVILNNRLHPFTYKNNNYPGIIIFKVKKGIYEANIIFTDTPIRKYSQWLSLTSLFAISFNYFYLKNRIKRK